MEKSEQKLLEDIKKRLEVIICLLFQSRPLDSEEISLREQIRLLHDFGLKPKEISEILERSNTYVNKELSELRKPRKSQR